MTEQSAVQGWNLSKNSLLERFGLGRLITVHSAGSVDLSSRRPGVRVVTYLAVLALSLSACSHVSQATGMDCSNNLVPSHFDSVDGIYHDGKAIYKDTRKNKGLLIANCEVAGKDMRFDVKKPESGDGFFFRLKFKL